MRATYTWTSDTKLKFVEYW